MNYITNNNNIDKDDEVMIRQMMHESKKMAPENLKYRIMNQIETEELLTRKRQGEVKPSSNPLKSFWTVFGIMYAVIILFTCYTFFIKGVEYLKSSQFINIVVFISAVFSLYWLMTRLEEYYLGKRINKK